MMSETSYLGAGMKFPPAINPATGRFIVASDAESVKQSIYLILMTQKTERFVRPTFGSNLLQYTFMDVNLTTINMMSRTIAEQIQEQEPRVRDVQVTADTEIKEGCLVIGIDYYIIDSNVRDNFVFPFYLNVTEEKEEYEPEQFGEGITDII